MLQRVAHTEGGLVLDNDNVYRHEFHIKDHLGNIRVTYHDKDLNGLVQVNANINEIKQVNHYYPFGLNMEGNWNGSFPTAQNKYQYNGKEWNDEFGLGWNDYGARFYDPTVARWNSTDLLSDKYRAYSPYNYCVNNPIIYSDPTGMAVEEIQGGYRYTGEDVYGVYNLLTSQNNNYYFFIAPYTVMGEDGKQYKNPVFNDINNYEKNKKPNGWSVFAGRNLKELVNLLGVLKVASTVDNVVLETHGSQSLTQTYLLIQEGGGAISDLNMTTTEIFQGQTDDSKYLKELMNLVKVNGNFVFAACDAGKGGVGDDFLRAASKLSENKLNVFTATDWVGSPSIKSKGELNFGGDRKAGLKDGGRVPGWKGINREGEITPYTKIQINLSSNSPIQFIK